MSVGTCSASAIQQPVTAHTDGSTGRTGGVARVRAFCAGAGCTIPRHVPDTSTVNIMSDERPGDDSRELPTATLAGPAALNPASPPSPERLRRIHERTMNDPVWRRND